MSALQRGGTISQDLASKLYPGMSARDASIAARNDLMSSDLAFRRSGQAGEPATGSFRGAPQIGELPVVGGEAKPMTQAIGEFASGMRCNRHPDPSWIRRSSSFRPSKAKAMANSTEDSIRGTHYTRPHERRFYR